MPLISRSPTNTDIYMCAKIVRQRVHVGNYPAVDVTNVYV